MGAKRGKLTTSRLKQIIQEELARVLGEAARHHPVAGHKRYEKAISDYVINFRTDKRTGPTQQVIAAVVKVYEDTINKCKPRGDAACLAKAGQMAAAQLQAYRERTNLLRGPVDNEPWPVKEEHIFVGGSAEFDPEGLHVDDTETPRGDRPF
jgi:hypothetical protein